MQHLESTLLIGFILLAFILALSAWRQPRAALTLSRWADFVAAPNETPDGFYTKLYQELKSQLESCQMPFSAVGFGPKHLFSTRTIFGSRPVYLALRYRDITYYIYVAPAPEGLFVSSWLFSKYAMWEEHPILKWVLAWKLYHQTLFQFDVMEMFHGVAHGVLMSVIDDYRREQGLQPMEAHERRPVLHSFYAKMKQGTMGDTGGYVLPVTAVASTPSVASHSPVALQPTVMPLPVTTPATPAYAANADAS